MAEQAESEAIELPEGVLLSDEEAKRTAAKTCVGTVQTSKAGNWCDNDQCEAQYPAGRKLTATCEDGTCPISAGPWYLVPCTIGTDGYMSGCMVRFSSVTACSS